MQYLDDEFKYCIDQSSSVIYALSRKQLGSVLLNPMARTGIVGILKLDGVYDAWNKVLEELKKMRDDWMKKYEDDCKYLWSASYYGHFDLIKEMFKKTEKDFPKILNQGNVEHFGRTPLTVAVERNHLELVKFLLEIGADEEIPDFCLNFPIHFVKSWEIAKLLKYNEKLNVSGFSAIEIVLETQKLDFIKEFIINNNVKVPKEKLLKAAIKAKNSKSIEFLAHHYVIKTFSSDHLMTSIENGSYEVFKFLIGRKCPVTEECLGLAQSVGNEGILRYLEKYFKGTSN